MYKYPRLKSSVVIKKNSYFCILVDKIWGHSLYILPQEALILSLCDGSLNVLEIAQIYSITFDLDIKESKNLVNFIIKRSSQFIDSFETANPVNLEYLPEEFIYKFEVPEKTTRVLLESPLELTLPLTHKCNLRCIYCFRASGEIMANELSVEEHIDAVKQSIDLGIVRCSVTGGEPTISKAFWPIVELLIEHDVYPYIATNGTTLTKRDAERLISTGVSTIQISFDAVTENVFDKLVGKKGFQKRVISAIEACVQTGLAVRLKSTLTKENYFEVDKIIEFSKNIGVSSLGIDAFLPAIFGRGNNRLELSKEDRKYVSKRIEEKRTNIKDLHLEPFPTYDWETEQDITSCGGLLSAFTIQPNGDIGFCELFYDSSYAVGNIRETKLSEIWGNENYLSIITPSDNDLNPICRSCEFLLRCGTGCFNLSLLNGDSIFDIDPRCWKVKSIAKEI